MGKGSTRRPARVSPDQYASNYERTFGKAWVEPGPYLRPASDPNLVSVRESNNGFVVYNSRYSTAPRATNDISPDK